MNDAHGQNGTGEPVRSPRPFPEGAAALAAGLACAVLVVAVFTGVRTPEAIWAPRLVDHPGFTPVDTAVVQEHWPASRAAVIGAIQGLAGFVVGESVPLATAAAAIAVLVVFLVLRRWTGRGLVAAASALGLAFGGLFWSRSAGGQPAVYAALFALAGLGSLASWRERNQRQASALAAAAAIGLTVAIQPVAAAGVPVLLLYLLTAPSRSRAERAIASLALVATSAGGLLLTGFVPGLSFEMADWLAPGGLPGVLARTTALGSVLVSDFGVLGLGFLAAGVLALLAQRSPRLFLIGGWITCVTAMALVWAAPDWRTTALPALVPAWLIIGLGMQAVLDASTGGRRAVAVVTVVLLPIMSLPGHYWMGTRAGSAAHFIDEFIDGLEETLPEETTFLAEGGPVDRLVLGRAAGSAPGWNRIAQDPERIEQASRSGRHLVAFAGARANLEPLGFRFEPLRHAGVMASLDELLDSVPSGWIVAVAAGTALPRALPPAAQPTFEAIGGRTQLFGMRQVAYAAIGIKGDAQALFESADSTNSTVELRAGDAVRLTWRAPASVRASSTADGGVIEYSGHIVARSTTGIALAVISTTGELAGAFAAESGPDMRLRIVPGTLAPARLTGREPCLDLDTTWRDASGVTRFGSVGALMDRGERLVLYVSASHPLNPHLAPLRHSHVPVLAVEPFRFDAPGDRARLDERLARDAVPATFLSDDDRWIYRVDAEAPADHRAQLALRLGGFADRGVARVELAGDAQAVAACAATLGGTPLLSSSASADLPLEREELFPFGWDRVEQLGDTPVDDGRSPRADRRSR